MKKITQNIILLASITTFGLVSCQKDKQVTAPNQEMVAMSSQQGNIKIVSFSTNHGNIKVLQFPNWQVFDQTAKTLNAQVQQIEDSFVNANAHLSERALNDLEESLNPNFERPLEIFENQYQFSSYRRVFNAEMNNWLGKSTLDFSKSPKNKTLFSGAELSLLNQHQQVMIGDSLYHLTGTKYAVIGGNYANAIDFVLDNPNAVTFTGELQTMAWWFIGNAPGCSLWKKEGITAYETSNRKIRTNCGIRSFTVYCKFLAEAESYEWKNSKWKKYRTDLTVYLTGNSRDINCENVGNFPMDYKSKKRKELEAETIVWGTKPNGSSHRAQNGTSIFGDFGYHGTSSPYVLVW